MVLRIAGITFMVVCVLFTLNAAVAQAAYPGPAGPPMGAPTYGPSTIVPVGPGFVTSGPAMAMPRSMSCAPACPPPCPPPCGPAMCAPPCQSGFNPLSAVWGMVCLPFKFIGGLFNSRQACQDAPMCPPQCCMPMLPPACGPACPPPITKVKQRRMMMPRAASHHAPVGVPMMQ